MKKYALLVVAFCGGVAAADPMTESGVPAPPEQNPHGFALEVGPLFGRVDLALPGKAAMTKATAEMVHFAPHLNLNSFLYLAVGIDVGRLTATGPSQTSIVTDPTEYDPTANMGNVPLEGSIAQFTGAVGVRGFAGMFSGGGELAAGARSLHVENVGQTGGNGFFDTVYQLRGRFDVWPTEHLTVGALAQVDLQEFHNLSAGIVIGWHFLPYDAAR
jgi:hypothetical protein